MEQQRGFAGEKPVVPLVARDWSRKPFADWLRRTRPDVVVSPDILVYRWLVELGWRIPEEIGFVWLEAVPEEGITGVCQHFENVGIASVDLLHLELIRSAYGIPSVRQTISIDGIWFEGRTLRAADAGT
jgi:LacI family transcriptional regulator